MAADEESHREAIAAPVASTATASAPSSPSSSELPAALPLRRGSEPALPTDGVGVPGLIVLAALLALTVGWAVWRRRATGTGGATLSLKQLLKPQRDGVQILQSVRLTAHTSVHVIEWNGHQHLLACGEGAVEKIADRESTLHAVPRATPGTDS